VLYPQTDCRVGLVIALTARGAKLMDADPRKFAAKLEALPGCNATAVRAFLEAGPETKIYIEPPDRAPEDRPLETSLAIRLRIPYRNPTLCDLRLNGRLLAESPADGFQRWYGDGYTQVQINTAPEKTRQSDLLVVTCAYAPDVRRQYGWRAPAEVVKRLQRAPSALEQEAAEGTGGSRTGGGRGSRESPAGLLSVERIHWIRLL
jgi:hypothetical protein